MPLFEPGRIAEGVYFLGHRGVCLYLIVDRDKALLIDSGMTPMAPLLLSQIREVLGERPLTHHLLTHSHFDHLGCSHEVLRVYSGITVAAHPYVEEVLSNPRAVERIRALNEEVLEGGRYSDIGITPFQPFHLTHKLRDGEILSLDRRAIIVYETPGHTRDSLSFFLPDIGLLVPGEALGVPDLKGRIMPEFLQDYNAYERSLLRLCELPVRILGLPHYGILIGGEAREYLMRVLPETRRFRDLIAEALSLWGGDLRATLAYLDEKIYDPSTIAQPRKPFLINLEAMVRAVKLLPNTA